MKHGRWLLVLRTRTACTYNSMTFLHQSSLYKQVAEGGMCSIRTYRRQHYFGIDGYFNDPFFTRPVGQVQSSQLYIILGRYHYFGMRFNRKIAAAELSTPLRKHGFIVIATL